MKSQFLLLCFFVIAVAKAQEKEIEPIAADRPDQTETPSIVPKGMFQSEVGFSYQRNNADSYALPSVLWKYGVNELFELRLITEFVLDKTSGITPVLIGCKIKLCEEKGIIPKTSFILHLQLPNAATSQYKVDYLAPQFRFAMQHTLSNKLSLGYNLGSEWNGSNAEPTYVYTLTIGYSFTERLGGYAEVFGFVPQRNAAEHNLDGGFTYLVSRNFMLDLSSGFGITANAPDYYIAAGFSFRI